MNPAFDRFQGTSGYVASEPLRHAVNVALALERPLLLRGEPGHPLSPEDMPLTIAVSAHKPAHRSLMITAADGKERRLAVTAISLFAHADEFVGALALFWEDEGS